MTNIPRSFSPTVQAVIADFIPICRALAGDQPYAISVSGSLGKGTWDNRSDIDFRLYTRDQLPWTDTHPDLWVDYTAAIEAWMKKGVFVDGVWCRTIGEIDSALDTWLSGKIAPTPLIWTIWGYHVLPDMAHQFVIEDPYHIIAGWKQRLSVYPSKLKQAILTTNTESLRYWHADYHYQNKVERGDFVFLAGMSSKLVHEIIQILFALNETYYVGDGSNLAFVEKFKIVPPDFSAKVQTILYPPPASPYQTQYAALAALIDEILAMVVK
jgi:hypothetical protein